MYVSGLQASAESEEGHHFNLGKGNKEKDTIIIPTFNYSNTKFEFFSNIFSFLANCKNVTNNYTYIIYHQ